MATSPHARPNSTRHQPPSTGRPSGGLLTNPSGLCAKVVNMPMPRVHANMPINPFRPAIRSRRCVPLPRKRVRLVRGPRFPPQRWHKFASLNPRRSCSATMCKRHGTAPRPSAHL